MNAHCKNTQKPETEHTKKIKKLIYNNKHDIINFIHKDKTYKEIYDIIKIPCCFNTFNTLCTKTDFIKQTRKKIYQERYDKAVALLKQNIPITHIRNSVKLSFKSIYNIANNNNIILKNCNRSKAKKPHIQKPMMKKMYKLKFNEEYIPTPKKEPYKQKKYTKPEIYPTGFTEFMQDEQGKYQIPHAKQCNFVMTDKITQKDFYCNKPSTQILSKSNYCLECYLKAHDIKAPLKKLLDKNQ